MQYYVIQVGIDPYTLEEQVNKLIRNDPSWEPAGGVFVDQDGNHLQAMFRRPQTRFIVDDTASSEKYLVRPIGIVTLEEP